MVWWTTVGRYRDVGVHAGQLADSMNEAHQAVARDRDDHPQQEIDLLRLALEAAWGLIADKTGMTTQDLVDRMVLIDRSDGVEDGRHQPPPRACPSCEAMVPPERANCQFCGASTPGQHPLHG